MTSKLRLTVLVITVALAYTFWGLLLSLQPAFYPIEAESKGATPSQYGLVFGIVSLAAFIFSPIFAHFGSKIGPKLLYNVGGFVQGLAAFAFGSLEFVNGTWTFIGLSYVLRFIDGVANAACSATIVSILMTLIPGHESSITAWTEMFLGFGYMFGPVLGSLLFEVGGFALPYYVVGGIVLVLAFALLLIVPNVKPGSLAKGQETKDDTKPSLTIKNVVTSFRLSLPFLDNFIIYCGNGMVDSMLQPHMRKSAAQATQFQVSMAFLLMAAFYMLSTPVVGYACDRIKSPILFSIAGNIFMFVAFLFVGPAPFFPSLSASVPLLLGIMPIFGLGYGFVLVSTFSRAYKESVQQGYRDDVNTYMVLTGLWTASFHLGSFVGPTVAGFIVDAIGFPQTSQISMAVFLLMAIVDCIQYYCQGRKSKSRSQYENLT
ncbi:MFS-type transporter SLC18B1-like [Tigriopus californicus]|uniref:MFS-type transporter SLC18B1-like n=1 Tax=Tigriopus californicus TaxID=6832 RepID=UPI0027DA5691|nr:MFS-type transporter SLC18B1-like [Tigriopus californicus]